MSRFSYVIFYGDFDYSLEKFSAMCRTIEDNEPAEIIVIDQNKNSRELPYSFDVAVKWTGSGEHTLSHEINEAFQISSCDYVVIIDNRYCPVYLKKGFGDILRIALKKHKDLGFLYGDYELIGEEGIKEVRLLKHHPGRLRDMQDYGKVYLVSRKALEETGYIDEKVKYKVFYDLRLRISEKYELVHISNKYSGSLYSVESPAAGHNVFAYLLEDKEVQKEAEYVLTEHLKRIGAYLPPGSFYRERPPERKDCPYKASIIIPVNNRPDFINVALSSALSQTVKNIEIIVVVNGGEDDPTADEVRKYLPGGEKFVKDGPEVRLIVTDINNIGFCLNLGVEEARSPFYVQLDSDDRLKPDAVEKILNIFESDRKIGVVIGSYEVWERDSQTKKIRRLTEIPVVTHDEWTEENGRNNLLRINGAGAPRAIPIEVIKEMGYFSINDEPYSRNYGEDYEMVLKISERYRVGRIYEPIYEVIRHAGSTDHMIDQETIDRNDEAKDYMRLEAIKRRKRLNKRKETEG